MTHYLFVIGDFNFELWSIKYNSKVILSHFKARAKADKKRQKMQEVFEKATHQQRQEQAQQRREEKRRVEKERLMAEEDPDKARKLEVNACRLP